MSACGKSEFRHEAFFYAGEQDFLSGTVPFIRSAVAAGDPVLVAVNEGKGSALREHLNGEGELVHFADMEQIGRNPACIIPAWQDFVAGHGAGARPLRGIGEPIWAERSPAELVECQHHESLLNLAFADTPAFWLLCPYDTDSLAPDVVERARRTHPYIAEGSLSHQSEAYLEPGVGPGPFEGELPPPSGEPQRLAFTREGIREVRSFVSEHASSAGLASERTSDLVLAASELATNSVLHGGGEGTVSVWREHDALLCEVRDRGRLGHPLAGRERPNGDQASGRGLWLVNHLCDLVQIRSLQMGNVVRVHMRLA